MPVFPDVGSTMVSPGFNSDASSAASIIARAIRSLTLPPGFKDSILPSSSAPPEGVTRESLTIGVLPMRSRTLSAMPPRRAAPGSRRTEVSDDIAATYPVVFHLSLGEVRNGDAIEDLPGGFLDVVPDLVRGATMRALVVQM